MNYLLALLIQVIMKNGRDVFNQSSIYQNNSARALIELSSTVFIIWIIFLILYKIILVYIRKDYKPKVKKIIIRKTEKKLPDNYLPITMPDIVYRTNTITIEEHSEKSANNLESNFTIEEYKLFSQMLKNNKNKKREHEDNKYQAIDSAYSEEIFGNIHDIELESHSMNQAKEKQKQEIIRMEEERRNLLKKEQERLQQQIVIEKTNEKKSDIIREEEKLTELEMLYRSIR